MTPGAGIVDVRDAELPRDRDAVERLWLAYLSWGNDEMEARHGFRLPVREAVERDLGTIEVPAARRANRTRLLRTPRLRHRLPPLDSPDFMSAAHAMYRGRGFVDIEPYAESEIPDEYKSHWVFMEWRPSA
jgi:hypothetical protein